MSLKTTPKSQNDPRTKADYVLEAIPEQLFPRVAAWLDNQDQNQDVEYENLKSYLLQEFTLSVSARAQKLLSLPHIPLGDTTAHAAWNEMQALATLPDLDPTTNKPRRVDLMRELWLQRLPPLASRKPDTTYSASAEDVPDINAANKRRPNSQVRHYKPGSASSQPSHGFCYYHYRFGAGAHKCLPGCQWPKKRVMGPPLPAKVATQNPRRGNVNALDNSASGFLLRTPYLVANSSWIQAHSVLCSQPQQKTKLVPGHDHQMPMEAPSQSAGRSFTWDFIIADVKTPLLGADFLGHHGLLVDVANRSNHQYTEICTVRADTPYDSLCKEYPDVFRPELRQQPGQPAKHGIFHYIKTTGPPVHSKFRLLSPEKLQAAKQAYSEMERMGICQKASSPWASPLHLVRKPEGTWRPCGDYRRLNLITEPDHYPLPNMADLTSNLHGAKVFSKLDP
ncbi:Transposon Ty3-I Gag-Pol polyprotein [Penaeus vannamei]|uniref:Transposon Ty3-I Gag-Pol polyprotein n=1 Tax=Penaeus vannamei TaxID=6689 RepID=A0A423U989_PENVA|nr:Transposon Ty3-I Gag-Pol polyprotein [Penaeus vannamei]